VCIGTTVHYEQTVRLSWKGNEWPGQDERRMRRVCSGALVHYEKQVG